MVFELVTPDRTYKIFNFDANCCRSVTARFLADLTTNIAEEVIFYAQARVVKHHAEEKQD
jgi:hypothetical protein